MNFTLSERHLQRLCKINSFPIPQTGLVFFGLRGCLPVNADDNEFRAAHVVYLNDVNYIHPRCTLGQWDRKKGRFALFPGSTVPHIKYIKMSKERNGLGANQLMTGYYRDYRKGVHKEGTTTAHSAFRQIAAHPIRRTADDFDFDNDDRVEFQNPYDNIHAAWCMGVNHDDYASAGCQVVIGYPQCEQRGNKPPLGPWKKFAENAYSLEQSSFPYLLLNSRDALSVSVSSSKKLSARLRFGSEGDLVSLLQKALGQLHFYEGIIDGDFGERTIRAVLRFQENTFGPNADDGVVGPMTASALGLSWPNV